MISPILRAGFGAAFAWATADVSAEQIFTGQSPGGAFYTIQAPDEWQPADGLVIYNHGFDIDQVQPDPDLGVLADFVLDQGFAIAASSYQLNGWALFRTLQDNRELYQQVVAELGEPEKVIVFGGSLGGLVTMQAVEQGGLGNVVGAYPVCAPLYGSEVWRQAVDLRLVYDAVCEGISGGRLPGGTSGLPFSLDPDEYDGILGNLTAAAVGAAVARCTGLELPEVLRTSGQERRMSEILDATGMSEDFLGINLAYATFVLSDLTYDEQKLNQRIPIGNLGVDYGDEEINADIARVEANPFDALFFKKSYTPTGDIGNTKVLATATDKDGLVVVEHLHAYAEHAPQAQLSTAVVVEDEASHCGYSEAEVVAGWQSLLHWIDTDEQPDATSVQADCNSIVSTGMYPGPCRYDPTYEVRPISTRILPRPDEAPDISPRLTGSFFIPGKGGQGWFIELLSTYDAVMYWFTFDADGQPIWIGGTGKVIDDSLVFEDTFITTGARFGPAFDPDDVQLDTWGTVEFVFTGDDSGLVQYTGPESFGTGTAEVAQLTKVGSPLCSAQGVNPGFSGLWYPEDGNGQGLVLEITEGGRVFAAWFTYDTEGRQTWFYGEGTIDGNTVSASLGSFFGPRFGDAYDASDLVSADWGRIEMRFTDDDAADFSFSSSAPRYPQSGAGRWIRLTQPLTQCGTD